MYLKKAIFLNCGPIADLELTPEFNGDLPKPVILVGTNGSGKTNALSIIADALQEIAAKHYQDVLPTQGTGHSYYRLLGGATQRLNTDFSLSALKFDENGSEILFLSSNGSPSPGIKEQKLGEFNVNTWPLASGTKNVEGSTERIPNIFRIGSYAFFPANRFELPNWLNIPDAQAEPGVSFNDTVTSFLKKPIVVQSSMSETKEWLANIMFDFFIDPDSIMNAKDLHDLQERTLPHYVNSNSVVNIVSILRELLQNQTARITRLPRQTGSRKIGITDDKDGLLLPSLGGLSS